MSSHVLSDRDHPEDDAPRSLTPLAGRQRIGDNVYAVLRQAIFNGELQPGARLSVPALATQLGVSRSPVREAVLRLIQDGLAEEEPHKGAVVVGSDLEQLLAMYEVREVLEGLAARLAASRRTADDVDALRKTLRAHEQAIESDDFTAHVAADMRFHSLVRAAARNSELATGLDQLQSKIQLAMLKTSITDGPRRALADHRKIFAAVKSAEPERAEAAARAHVSRLHAALLRGLEPST